METDVVTVHPNTTVGEAIIIGERHRVNVLPVTLGERQLAGIVTTRDLYKVIVQALGFGEGGRWIRIYECNLAGRPFGEILDVIAKRGISIRTLFHVTPPGIRREDCILHLDTDDVNEVLSQLQSKGYQVEARPLFEARH